MRPDAFFEGLYNVGLQKRWALLQDLGVNLNARYRGYIPQLFCLKRRILPLQY